MSKAFVLLNVLNVLAALAAGEPGSAGASSSAPTSAAAGAASSQPAGGAGGASQLEMWVASVGLCILAAYVVYRWARPAKLKLSPVPRRANEVHPSHVLLLFALNIMVQYLLFVLLTRLMGADTGRVAILAGIGSQVLWLPAIVLVARSTFPRGLARGMGLSVRHWFLDGLRGVIAYLAVFPVCVLLYWLAMPSEGGPVHPMIQALRDVGPGWKILDVLSAVVLAPLVEEMFFRGLLQSMLRRYWNSPWPAVVLTAVLFACTHVDWAHFTNWQWVPALTALGVVLGYNYERTGRLMAPIVVHALFNGVSMASQLLYGH